MALAKLSIDLEARLAGLQAGLDKAGLLAERQAARIEGAFKGLASVGSGLGIALAGAFSVAGISAFVRATVDGLDALNDFADATGTSIELASALEDVAARTGTSFDTVQTAVLKLNKVLADAKPGNDAANVLKLIGLNAEELKRLDPAEALRQTAVALAQYADDGNKARAVQELFGKSVGEVAPLLKDLAESGQLNATVTTEQAKAAEAFNIELFRMQKNVVDVARDLSGPMIKAINETIEKFRQGAKEGKGFFETLREQQLQLLGLGAPDADIAKNLRSELEKIDALLEKGVSSDQRTYQLRARRLEVVRQLGQAEAKLVASNPDNYSNEGRNRGRPSLPNAVGIKTPPKVKASAAEFVGPVLDDASLAAIKALENTDVARISALREQLQQLIAIRGSSSDTTRVDEALANTVEQLAKLDPAAQAAAASAERLKAILSSTPGGQLAGVLADIELLNRALEAGQITYEQWGEAARTATARAGAQSEAEIEKISTFADQAGRNIQDALGDSLEQALTGNFSNIGDLWRNLLVQMAAQAAAAQLNDYLFGSTFGGKGAGPGVLGDLFKTFGGFFATGGMLGAGQWGIAGENGPEPVVGPARIVSNRDAFGGGGSGPQVTQHYHINGDVSPQTVALIRNMGASVKADILRSSRTGGAYAGGY